MVDIAHGSVLIEKSFGLELLRLGPVLFILHRRPHVHQDERVLGNEVITERDVVGRSSRQQDGSGAVAAHGLEQHRFDVRHSRTILVARWTIGADHAIDLLVHAGLNSRMGHDVEDGPVQGVRDGFGAGDEQILNERIEIGLGEERASLPVLVHFFEVGVDDVRDQVAVEIRLAFADQLLDDAIAVLDVLEDVLAESTRERQEVEAGDRGRLIEVLVDLLEQAAHVDRFEVPAEGQRADVVARDLTEHVTEPERRGDRLLLAKFLGY